MVLLRPVVHINKPCLFSIILSSNWNVKGLLCLEVVFNVKQCVFEYDWEPMARRDLSKKIYKLINNLKNSLKTYDLGVHGSSWIWRNHCCHNVTMTLLKSLCFVFGEQKFVVPDKNLMPSKSESLYLQARISSVVLNIICTTELWKIWDHVKRGGLVTKMAVNNLQACMLLLPWEQGLSYSCAGAVIW